MLRGGYGISYVHFHRAGGANVLPINGPQVINAVVVQTNPLDPAFRRTEQGYPAGLTDPSRFNPLAANITYMPRDYHSSQVQSWFASVQRELGPQHAVVDVAYVGNRADDLLLFANFNQARPNNAAGTIPLQARRPIPEFADITYSFNGGKSRYHALQAKFDWRMRGGLLAPQLADAVADEGQRRRLARESERQLPGAAGLLQPGRRLRPVGVSPAVQQHDELRLEPAVRPAPLLGGWQIAGDQQRLLGRAGDVHLHAGARRSRCRASQQDFRGANNYRPNVTGDPYAPEGERTVQNWFNRSNVVDPDRSEPAVRQRRRATACAGRCSGRSIWRSRKRIRDAVARGAVELRAEFFNLFNRTNFRAPNGNRSAAAFGTITQTYDPRQVQLGVRRSASRGRGGRGDQDARRSGGCSGPPTRSG